MPGNVERNATHPISITNVLHSARILGDTCEKLRRYSLEGITLDNERISQDVEASLLLVTALSLVIGYDKASAIAHKALGEHQTLREAALERGFIRAEEFDKIVVSALMAGDPSGTWRATRSPSWQRCIANICFSGGSVRFASTKQHAASATGT